MQFSLYGMTNLLRICHFTYSISKKKIRLWLSGDLWLRRAALHICPYLFPVILVGFLPRALQVPPAMGKGQQGASKHLGEDREWTPVRCSPGQLCLLCLLSHDSLHGTQAPGREETREWPLHLAEGTECPSLQGVSSR